MPTPAATPAARYQSTTGLWRDTAGTVPAVAEGDPIARWDDQSGLGRHLIQSDASKRPILHLSGINGAPVVRCDGATHFLQTAAFTLGQPWAGYAAIHPQRLSSFQCAWDGGALGTGKLQDFSIGAYNGGPAYSGYLGQYAGSYGAGVPFWDSYNFNPNGFVPVPIAASALYNGASSWVRVNDSVKLASSPGAGSPSGFTLGMGGDGSSFPGQFDYAEVILYDRSPSDPDDAATLAYLNATYALFPAGVSATAPVVLCHGDSRTWGSFATSPGPFPGTTSWPSVLRSLLDSARVSNYGVASQTAEYLLADAPYQVDPLFDPSATANVAIFWEAVNSWSHDPSSTPESVYASLASWVAGRKAAGFRTVVCTELPSSNGSVNGAHAPTIPSPGFWDGTTSTLFQPQYNALVRANSAGADVVVDLTADARLQVPTNGAYFASDGLHLVDAGYAVVAGLISRETFASPSLIFRRTFFDRPGSRGVQ